MSSLEIDVREPVAWIRLNRPSVGNAIDREVVVALGNALSYVEDGKNQVRCIVLTGCGKNFCSGVDLRSMQAPRAGSHENEYLMARSFLDRIVERMLALRIPIVAAVNGAAAGAGMTLALTADVIVMSEDAFFLPSFSRIGVVPDSGAIFLLSERIGASRARTALMLGDRIEAHTAKEWGLAHQVVAPEALCARAGEVAMRLASGPPRVLGTIRALLNGVHAGKARKHILTERSAHADALAAREHVEGCAAFFERREPKF